MNNTKRPMGHVRFALCGALAAALGGCTTYVEHRSPRTVYTPPPPPPVVVQPPPQAVYVPPPGQAPVVVTGPESPVVVIQAETDFYEPLKRIRKG